MSDDLDARRQAGGQPQRGDPSYREEARARGMSAGRAWVRRAPDFAALERLHAWRRTDGVMLDGGFLPRGETAALWVWAVIVGSPLLHLTAGRRQMEHDAFWTRILAGDRPPTIGQWFVAGFAEGAVLEFEEIRNLVACG